MNDKFLLLVYSAFLISSSFMLFHLARQACCEARRRKWINLSENSYFMLTFGLAILSVSLIGISSLRLYDGLEGFPVGGRWPASLSFFMTLLWLATVAFQWAGTIGRKAWPWRIFVSVTLLDLFGLAFWFWG